MTVDRYTKAVLTVIAGCLLWICAASAGVPLLAQREQLSREAGPWSDRAQPVVIVGTGTMDDQGRVTINLVEHQNGRRERTTDPTIPVALPYSQAHPLAAQLFYSPSTPLPVEISAVKKMGDWEPLRAAVEDAPTRPRPGGR